MYQAVAYHKRTNKVHIWDDKNGHFTINYKPYAYRKATYGNMVALDGQTVQRVENLIVTNEGYTKQISIQKCVL